MPSLRLLSIALLLAAARTAAAQDTPLSYAFSAFHGPPVHTVGQKLKAASGSGAERSAGSGPSAPAGGAPSHSAAPAETLRKLPKLRSEKPIVATAELGRGGETTVTFVFDESGGTGKGYDRLIVDANGNQDLTDDPVLRAVHRRGHLEYGPLALRIRVDGRRRLYHAKVEQYATFEGTERRPNPEFRLKSLGYYTGTARFGAKRHPVALVDANANGIYGEPFREFDPEGGKMGDMLLVDVNHDGRFEQGGIIPKETLYCGKCIVVDGRFYELALRPDGSAMSVTPARVRLASLKSGYPRFGLMLKSPDGVLPIESRNGVAQVPPGEYQVMAWSIEHRAGTGKWSVMGSSPAIGAPELKVSENGDTSFQLKSPLKAKVTAERNGPPGNIGFQLQLTTASGENIGDVNVDGRRPPEPRLRLLDEGGNEVADLKFHYG
jgi:hypothetical protein